MPKKKKPEKRIQKPVNKIAAVYNQNKKSVTPVWVLPFILILTIAAYIPALSGGFVNWDDPEYVTSNLLIRDLSNLRALITTSIQGNYHPLTMISLAINYKISGLDAWSYHLFNLFFHLINCWLVFRLAFLLSRQNLIIAFTTSVLFAVHPMHVESVAWVSERKDVLYSLFFLAGLITYTKYVDTNSRKQFALTIFFVVLSLLSKPAAVVFPLVLFCIDLLRKRPLTFKLFVEKIPFLIPALVMGYLTYSAQSGLGATGGADIFPLSTRIFMAFYGYMMYILKLFIPFNLSPFYPFPALNKSLPIAYTLAPVFLIASLVLFYFSLKKNRVVAFGLSFYLANLILVLQILPVGSAVIAERYSYMPYIGIFYILGSLLSNFSLLDTKKAFYVLIPVSILFSILTYKQSGIWKDGASLWDYAIKTNPNSKAYFNRAILHQSEKEFDKALDLLNKAIKENIADPNVYTTRANIYFELKKYDLAAIDYHKAIALKPGNVTTYDNLGSLYGALQKYDSALFYYDKLVSIKKDYKQVYYKRAQTYLKVNRYNDAIKDFQTFLSFEPNNADIYNTIGFCFRVQSEFKESVEQISKAIELNPQPMYYLNRSYSYFGLKNIEAAKKDALAAKQAGATIEPGYAKALGL